MSQESNDTTEASAPLEAAPAVLTVPPTAGEIKANRKNMQKAFYRLSVDLAQETKKLLRGVSDEQIKQTIGAYLQMTNPPLEGEQKMIEVEKEVLQQLAILGSAFLSRYFADRLR